MVHVKQIEIVNFGPIERTSLKDLKAVNIIVGPNNDKFERVAIRGGYNYFVSDLSVYVE